MGAIELIRKGFLKGNTVYFGFCDQPPVIGVGVAKPNSGRYFKWIFAWFSDQVVAKANADNTPLGLATSKSVDCRYFTI